MSLCLSLSLSICVPPPPPNLSSQPELLAGKRYEEDVDIFSFGVVLYEVAARDLPYKDVRMSGGKKENRKGVMTKMMREWR